MWCVGGGVSSCGETVRGSNVRRDEAERKREGGVGVGGGRVGVMQPWQEPKLDVSFRHISPDAAGIHMSSLVIYLPAGWKQVGLHDVHSAPVCTISLWVRWCEAMSVALISELMKTVVVCSSFFISNPAGTFGSYRCDSRVVKNKKSKCGHMWRPSPWW